MHDRRHIPIPVLGKAEPPIGSDFVSLEAASGIALLATAIAGPDLGQHQHRRVHELLGPRAHHRVGRARDHRDAHALGQRRAHDHLLLRRRAGDQTGAGHRRVTRPQPSFVIVPLFALANAGVVVAGGAIFDALASRVTIGIVVGLVVGKFVSILGASALAVRFRVGRLPEGITLRNVAGIATLSGIGFTVSLFVTDLAFRATYFSDAKIGVLAASALAAAIGMTVLGIDLRPHRPTDPIPREEEHP